MSFFYNRDSRNAFIKKKNQQKKLILILPFYIKPNHFVILASLMLKYREPGN